VALALEDGADAGATVRSSIGPVRRALVSSAEPARQLGALAAVAGLAQKAPAGVVAAVAAALGADVVDVLWSYGTGTGSSDRGMEAGRPSRQQAACADAVRFLLVGLQHLVATNAVDDDEGGDGTDPAVPYLQVVLECLLGVLRSNGLPNHPAPGGGGDAAVGRLCAQAAVSAARVAPGPFKSCLARMAPPDRALVEFSVRGEMGGYADPATGGGGGAPREPAKKTLNVASFKR
jgi:hypothetical protein